MTETFISPDIECDGCAASIRKSLVRQPGIESVSVDVSTKAVTVQAQDGTISRAQIAETLADIGFPPQTIGTG